MRRTAWSLPFTLLCFAACSRKPTAAIPDAGAISVAPDAAGLVAPLSWQLHGELADAGAWDVTLQPGDRATIQRADALRLLATQPLRNARIRIFDEADRVLESDDTPASPDATILSYQMHFPAPLLTGHRYALVVDPETPGPMLDGAGHPLDELRFELTVAGERERPPVVTKHAGHRRRH